MACKKVRYKDDEMAKAAIKCIMNDGTSREKPKRSYYCDLCNGYHITKSEIVSDREYPNQKLTYINDWNRLCQR